MRYTRLGSCGPTVSVVGLGASHFGRVCDLKQTCAVVDAALDAGITFVDTAEAYPCSEELLGYALRDKRDRLFVSSKFGHSHTHPEGPRGSRAVVRASLEGTLHRLQTDYLDAYLMHMPDPETPLEETLSALHELAQEGRVRFIGLSQFAPAEIEAAQRMACTPLLCVQERYNLLNRAIERDVLPLCRQLGIHVVPAVPLASGLLTGRYQRGAPPASRIIPDETFDVLENLEAFAHARELSLLELAIGWLAAQPRIGPVITGATRPDQITANARASEWPPSAADLATIDRLTETTRRTSP